MITSMHIENFKCFKNFDIDLGPFNVLVGPNDSGKTSLLEAIRVAADVGPQATHVGAVDLAERLGFPVGFETVWQGLPLTRTTIGVTAESANAGSHTMSIRSITREDEFIFWSQQEEDAGEPHDWRVGSAGIPGVPRPQQWRNWFSDAIGEANYVRFTPSALRSPDKPAPEAGLFGMNGQGLPWVLHDSVVNDEEAFQAIERAFCTRFPEYKSISAEVGRKNSLFCTLAFHTRHGKRRPSGVVSDGVMLALAFLTLRSCSESTRVLLVEEPENGLHYARLKDVVSLLRELAEDMDTQVVLTTHSPYLLDCVEPEEVHVFSKDAEGAVHAARLSDHPDVPELKKYLMTGEIWTEFDEADIVAGKGAASE